MNKLTLKVKLGFAFGSLLAIVAVIAATGIYATYRLSAETLGQSSRVWTRQFRRP